MKSSSSSSSEIDIFQKSTQFNNRVEYHYYDSDESIIVQTKCKKMICKLKKWCSKNKRTKSI